MVSCLYIVLLSHVHFFATPWAVARQALLSMGFSRYEYWSGLPFPPPGDLLNPGIEPTFLTSPSLAGGFFTTTTTWEALSYIRSLNNLEFIFVYVWRNVPTCCFPCSCPAFLAPLTVEPVLFSGEIFELIWWDTTRWQSDAVVKCAYSQEFGNFFEQQHLFNLSVCSSSECHSSSDCKMWKWEGIFFSGSHSACLLSIYSLNIPVIF